MSRGFDGFEIDDFRGFDFGLDREVSRSPSSDWNRWTELHNIHREEERADRLDREGRDRSNRDRPPLAREERVQAILSQRVRTQYTDRNKTYSLRDSEIHTLSEVGKFRVVAARDLAEFAYNGDRSRVENDVESLARQGLMKETTIADPEHNPTQVVTLRKDTNSSLVARFSLQIKPPTTDSRNPTKLFTTPTSIGSITRSAMRSRAAAAKYFASNSTTK